MDLKPGYPSARRHLANSLAKLERYDEAEEEYKAGKTVRNYPNNNFDFGIFLLKIDRKKEAAEELKIAAKLFWEQGKEEDGKRGRRTVENPLKTDWCVLPTKSTNDRTYNLWLPVILLLEQKSLA